MTTPKGKPAAHPGSHRNPGRRGPGVRRRDRGIVLATSLVFLVVLTLLGVSMFRSTGLMDRIAAITRDKQRAFEAAQAALQYGETWLSQGKAGATSACNSIDVVANLHVCSNALAATFATDGFNAGFRFTPGSLTVGAHGGLVAAGGDVYYQQAPGLYIESKGTAPAGSGQVYQLTAYGFGGNASTQAVVRSIYILTAGNGGSSNRSNLGGP